MHAKKTNVRSILLALLAMLILAVSSAASPLQQDPPPNQSPMIEHYQNWAEPPQNMQKHSDMPSAEVVDPNYTAPPGPDPDAKNRMVYENYVVNNGSYDLFYAIVDGVDFDRITNTPADEYYPRFNGTAQRIVFVSNELGSADIFNSSYWGADKKAVVVSPAVDTMPAFSNDGSKIAFVSNRTGSAEIFICAADGGGLAQLTAAVEPDVEPDWTKDGTKIVWVRRSGSSGTLMVMNANGSSQHAISAPLPYAGRPRWSPNGEMIAFQLDANADGWLDLATIKADGSQLTVFLVGQDIDYPLEYWMGGWSSSGDKIFFTMVRYNFYDGQWWINESHIYSLIQKTLAWYPIVYSTGSVYSFNPDLQAYDQTAPEVALQPLQEFTQASQIKVPFHLYDSSGVYSWWFETRGDPLAEWTYANPSISGSCGTNGCEATAAFSGIPGTSLHIRLRAYDKSGNFTPDDPAKEVSTKMYLRNLTAQVMDVREQNLAEVLVSLIPAALNAPITTDGQGQASLFTAVDGNLTAVYSKTGYGSLPGQTVPVNADRSFSAIIPPYDDRIINGQFEAETGALTGWTIAGDLPVGSEVGRSGENAVIIGQRCQDVLCLQSPVVVEDLPLWRQAAASFAFDGQNRLNLFTLNKNWVLQPDGSWVNESTFPDTIYSRLKATAAGELYLLQAYSDASCTLRRKPNGGSWQEETLPACPSYLEIDETSQIHMIFSDGIPGGIYQKRNTIGEWGNPIRLLNSNPTGYSLITAPDGSADYVYIDNNSKYFHMRILVDGTLTPAFQLTEPWYSSSQVKLFRDQGGMLYVLGYPQYPTLWRRTASGIWLPPIDLAKNGVNMINVSTFGKDGSLYMLEFVGTSGFVYEVLPAGAEQSISYYTVPAVWSPMDLAVDDHGVAHFARNKEIAQGQYQILHQAGTGNPLAQAGSISQTVTIGEDVFSPTLSWFSKLASTYSSSQSSLRVIFTPHGGEPNVLVEQTGMTADWQHHWVDLTALKGQTGQLSFQLNQPGGEPWATVELDEISLGSWSTPVITSITPGSTPYPVADTWLTVWGTNFHPDAQVLVRDVPAAQIEWMSENELRFVPPSSLGMGFHPVEIINPGGANARSLVHLGSSGFIPLIRR